MTKCYSRQVVEGVSCSCCHHHQNQSGGPRPGWVHQIVFCHRWRGKQVCKCHYAIQKWICCLSGRKATISKESTPNLPSTTFRWGIVCNLMHLLSAWSRAGTQPMRESPTEVRAQLLPPHKKTHCVKHYSVELWHLHWTPYRSKAVAWTDWGCLGELKLQRYPSVYVKSISSFEHRHKCEPGKVTQLWNTDINVPQHMIMLWWIMPTIYHVTNGSHHQQRAVTLPWYSYYSAL